jgi:outer membrane protein with beta-barrel domain
MKTASEFSARLRLSSLYSTPREHDREKSPEPCRRLGLTGKSKSTATETKGETGLMKIRTVWLAIAALFLLAAITTNAQDRYEVTPFVGYETSGSYPVSIFANSGGTAVPIDRLRVNGAASYGAFFDYGLWESFQPEFIWNHNNTSYSAHNVLNNSYFNAFHSDVDQFQFGGLFMFRNSEHNLRPYAAASVGFTHEINNNTNPDRTAFSWSIGGGVKYGLSRHFGLRGDARYFPTYGSSSQGTYCDPFYGCYPTTVHNFLNRGSFTAGLIIKF